MAKKLRVLDENLVIGEDIAVTTTASGTPKQIVGVNIGEGNEIVALIDTGAVTGTVDGSNYYSLQLEASDLVGGTYVAVGNAVVAPAAGGRAQVGFTSEQLNDLVDGAEFFRITATKVGTTATAVTYTAQLTKA